MMNMHNVHNNDCVKLHSVHTGSYGMQSSIPQNRSDFMPMSPMQFSETREDLGLTQAEMGMRLGGYNWRTVASWEAGDRGIPAAVEALITAFDNQERLMETIMNLLTKRPGAVEIAKEEVEQTAGVEYRDYLKQFKERCAKVDGASGGAYK